MTDGPARPDHRTDDAAGQAPAASHVSLDERVVESRVIHRGSYLEVRQLTVERDDGSRASRDIVWHPGAATVVALDDEARVLLVRQFRVATGGTLLELPAGTLDVDPATGQIEDPDVAAARELEEETGYRAGSLERIAEFWTAPGFATELMYLYLARDLRPADAHRLGPEEDERLELERMPWPDAVAAVERGEIRDAKSIVGLLQLARRLGDGDVKATPEPGAGKLVSARFPMTTGDVLRASIALSSASRGAQVFGALLVASAFVLILAGDSVMGLLGIALGAALVTGLISVPFVWYQVRKRREFFSAEAELDADEQGVRMAGPFGSGTFAWSAFVRARERSGYLFLDTGVGQNVFVPQKALQPDDLEQLRSLIARHVGVDNRP